MKNVYLVFSLIFMTSTAISTASSSKDEHLQDVILLNTGELIKGEIVHFGSNSFKIETLSGTKRIKNNTVSIVAIGQELTSLEKMKLGKLDGKRYAKNKAGNFAIGFASGLFAIPTSGISLIAPAAAIYITSDQLPGFEAQNGSNKAIVNDENYIVGYTKGVKSKSTVLAVFGGIGGAVLSIIAVISVLS